MEEFNYDMEECWWCNSMSSEDELWEEYVETMERGESLSAEDLYNLKDLPF
jgi:hypothetical protein